MLITLIVVGALFAGWVLLNLKTSRPDATHIGKIHPYRKMMWHIMPGRNEAVVYYDTYVRAEKLLAYIEGCRKRFPCDVTHVLVGACFSGLVASPKMNRFVVGRRLYQRNDNIVTFSMKRQKLNKEAKLAAVKMVARHGDSFEQICKRINGEVTVERSGEKTYSDKELSLLSSLPRPVLNVGIRLFRWMDYHNILPGGFIKGDAMYTSVFIANLGSLSMPAGYHHLFEWGTCPLFMMVGQIEDKPVVEDGQLAIGKVLHVRWSYDERIEDGLTARFGIESVARVLSDPAYWLGCLADDGSDAYPIGGPNDTRTTLLT